MSGSLRQSGMFGMNTPPPESDAPSLGDSGAQPVFLGDMSQDFGFQQGDYEPLSPFQQGVSDPSSPFPSLSTYTGAPDDASDPYAYSLTFSPSDVLGDDPPLQQQQQQGVPPPSRPAPPRSPISDQSAPASFVGFRGVTTVDSPPPPVRQQQQRPMQQQQRALPAPSDQSAPAPAPAAVAQRTFTTSHLERNELEMSDQKYYVKALPQFKKNAEADCPGQDLEVPAEVYGILFGDGTNMNLFDLNRKVQLPFDNTFDRLDHIQNLNELFRMTMRAKIAWILTAVGDIDNPKGDYYVLGDCQGNAPDGTFYFGRGPLVKDPVTRLAKESDDSKYQVQVLTKTDELDWDQVRDNADAFYNQRLAFLTNPTGSRSKAWPKGKKNRMTDDAQLSIETKVDTVIGRTPAGSPSALTTHPRNFISPLAALVSQAMEQHANDFVALYGQQGFSLDNICEWKAVEQMRDIKANKKTEVKNSKNVPGIYRQIADMNSAILFFFLLPTLDMPYNDAELDQAYQNGSIPVPVQGMNWAELVLESVPWWRKEIYKAFYAKRKDFWNSITRGFPSKQKPHDHLTLDPCCMAILIPELYEWDRDVKTSTSGYQAAVDTVPRIMLNSLELDGTGICAKRIKFAFTQMNPSVLKGAGKGGTGLGMGGYYSKARDANNSLVDVFRKSLVTDAPQPMPTPAAPSPASNPPLYDDEQPVGEPYSGLSESQRLSLPNLDPNLDWGNVDLFGLNEIMGNPSSPRRSPAVKRQMTDDDDDVEENEMYQSIFDDELGWGSKFTGDLADVLRDRGMSDDLVDDLTTMINSLSELDGVDAMGLIDSLSARNLISEFSIDESLMERNLSLDGTYSDKVMRLFEYEFSMYNEWATRRLRKLKRQRLEESSVRMLLKAQAMFRGPRASVRAGPKRGAEDEAEGASQPELKRMRVEDAIFAIFLKTNRYSSGERFFRKVVATFKDGKGQIVHYKLQPGEEIPPETHKVMQIVIPISGEGDVKASGGNYVLGNQSTVVVVVPPGLEHTIRADFDGPGLEFFSIYSEALFPEDLVDVTQRDEEWRKERTRELYRQTVPLLRSELEERSLSTEGKKKELVRRLVYDEDRRRKALREGSDSGSASRPGLPGPRGPMGQAKM